MLLFDGADAVIETIRRFLADLFANSVMMTCPHFWELHIVEPRCGETGCPWWQKCPFAEEG